MMKSRRMLILAVLPAALSIVSCHNEDNKAAVPKAVPGKPELVQPFRYHKLVEVSPGQDYDVVSWGRGSSEVGAFAILHSDSAAAKYTTTTGDLDGSIVDVYNTDMDLDGNPEILIQVKTNDTVNYTTIYAFEFNGNRAQKLDFPKLTKKERTGYRGGDNFYVKDGKLEREFPIFEGSGSAAKPGRQKRVLEYGLYNNSFTVKQLSKDSTIAKPPAEPYSSGKAEKSKAGTGHKKKRHHR